MSNMMHMSMGLDDDDSEPEGESRESTNPGEHKVFVSADSALFMLEMSIVLLLLC